MQVIKAGKIHDVWDELVQEADERGAAMLQLRVPGLSGIVLLEPQAVHAVLKRPQWVPRHRPVYAPFHWLVRMGHEHLQSPSLPARELVSHLHALHLRRKCCVLYCWSQRVPWTLHSTAS